MPTISNVRPVLLSAPYADRETNLEVKHHLKSGYRTCGLVEITLDDGTTGLGEGYIAVFAPKVFEELIKLLKPHLEGRDVMNFNDIYGDLLLITGYWSMQGAAQHAISAIEIALQDCRAQVLGIPVYKLFGGNSSNSIKVYGSGGDSISPKAMKKEFDYLEDLGIDIFKIRARRNQTSKVVWCQREGRKRGINIAVDMTQNLINPGQSVTDVVSFYEDVTTASESNLYFLEEVLGPQNIEDYLLLRNKINTQIAGGEIVTTEFELCNRIEKKVYDIVQPDATVIGGISPVLNVFSTARRHGTEVIVHCWGGPVGMKANFHAAVASGGKLAEWPMPTFPLRDEMVKESWKIENGMLKLPDNPGLGVKLAESIEKKFPFREDAIYECLVDSPSFLHDEIWK